MSILPGTKLGRYEIRSKIGEGGMGEVYSALDTELDRTVAIKILPEALAAHQQRLQRFIQEAKSASALNHPHILTIYEIGTAGNSRFIATEFIDGETLRQRINEGMKLLEILEVASQIASALSAAHAAGIIHRDIKPENIMVRRDGYIKVLDFGLAKLTEPEGSTTDPEAKTKAMVNTGAGTVMGTANYMSPEQAKGTRVDARTDLWSLGAVLYEMIAGRVPFPGETPTETISLILQRESSPLARSTHEVPAELERIVMKALTKDREERYQTAKDLLIDLRNLKRKLEVDVEIERTVAPELRSAAPTSGDQLTPATVSGAMAATTPVGAAPAASSAEYIVSGIKQHKVAVGIAVIVLMIGMVGIAAYFHARNTEVVVKSIAVLPFENASGNSDVEYLSDGLTESLINSLSHLPNLKVMSRSSVFRYKGRETDARAVGRALGVEAVLTGRIMQRGDALNISIELVNARDNTHIWGDQYDRKISDLLRVQQEIAREVAEKLRLRLNGEEQRRVTKRYTENPEAYELYLKGQYSLNKATEPGVRKSIEYFQQAIDKDPNFALAYSAVGTAYATLGGVLGFESPREVAPQGKAALMKALAIDDTLDDVHATLANFKLYFDWDWPDAEKEYKRALELNPNNEHAHSGYGTYLESLGRFDEAVAEREHSRQLDPISALTTADVGYPLYYARRYPEALDYFRKGIELDPNLSWGHLWAGQVYLQQGRHEEAINEINRAIALSGGNVRDIATLGHAYAVSGNRTEALKVIDQLQRRAAHQYVSSYFIALIYSGLDDKDQAFAWFEKAYAERYPYLILIKVEPVFDNVRSDPRFTDLMRRVGFPQ